MYLKATAKSKALMGAVDFHVILPYHDGYPDANRPYPTLYFLPGFSGNAEEIVFALPLRQMAAKYGLAIVVPDGENAFYTDHPERAACHGVYVGEELPRITRRLFPCLSSRREDTFIGGISMGGYGAAVLGLHYPHHFSKIALFSPAIEADRLLNGIDDSVPGAVPSSLFDSLLGGAETYDHSPRLNPLVAVDEALQSGGSVQPLWMCCGENDMLVRDACADFSQFLTSRAIDHIFIRGRGEHDLIYWDAHLEEAFQFLMGTPRF